MASHSSILAWKIPWTEEPVATVHGQVHEVTKGRPDWVTPSLSWGGNAGVKQFSKLNAAVTFWQKAINNRSPRTHTVNEQFRQHRFVTSIACTLFKRTGTRDALTNSKGNFSFPSDSVVKNLSANVGDTGSNHRWGRSPGEEIGNPLHYSCLGIPMYRGSWWATVHRVTKSQMTEATAHADNVPMISSQ